MSEPLEQRVAALEDKVKFEAIARRSMEDDLDKIQRTLDAHSGILDGLGRTQREHTRSFAQLADIAGETARVVNRHSRDVGEVKAGVERLTDLVERLIERGRRPGEEDAPHD